MLIWKLIKNGSNLNEKKNKLSKVREIYFKYFLSHKVVRTKATVRKRAMMGLPPVSSIRGKHQQVEKEKHHKSVSRGSKRWNQKYKTQSSRRWFRPGMQALQEICRFQKSTDLHIPKAPFLLLVREILQREHGDHHVQAGAVLALHKASEAYLIWLLEDTNLCAIHMKHVTICQEIWGWLEEYKGKM